MDTHFPNFKALGPVCRYCRLHKTVTVELTEVAIGQRMHPECEISCIRISLSVCSSSDIIVAKSRSH